MNKIFKVIFNKTTGQLVVASEMAKANGKSSSTTDNRTKPTSGKASALIALGLAGAALLGVNSAHAASIANGSGSQATGVDASAYGNGTKATGGQAVAVGAEVTASGEQSVSIGNNLNVSGRGAIGISGDDVAGAVDEIPESIQGIQGIRAQYEGGNSFLWRSPVVSGRAAVAIGAQVQASQDWATALGARSEATAEASTAVGALAKATGSASFAGGLNATASSAFTTAVGANATASGTDASAYGYNSTSSGANSVAIGKDAAASGTNATVLGVGASATASEAVVVGRGASASNSDAGSIAIGKNAVSDGKGAAAIGTSSNATGAYAMAIGDIAKAYATDALAVGVNATVNTGATNSIAMGRSASVGADSNQAIVIGNSASTTASSSGTVIVGGSTSVQSQHVTALGYGTNVGTGKDYAVVLGSGSSDTGSHAIATETGATVNGVTYSGFKGVASTAGRFVSVGSAGNERKIINVAAGNVSATSTEAINGSQLYAVANEVANAKVKYFSVNSTTANNQNNNGATAAESLAIGPNATAAGKQSIAIGLNSTAANGTTNTIAIGRNANASADSGTAIGNSAHSAQDSAAYGVLANASALRTTAIGPVARALAGNATAVGNEAMASETFATAIGDKANASVAGAVAIGSGSVADRGVPSASGWDWSTNAASTLTDKTWRANAAAVSVGNATHTRQIINVAAGSEDTDAVNVAQLKKVAANAASATRAYTFNISNGDTAQTTTTGQADQWILGADDTITFGATSNLSVSTDANGKIIYDLSSTFADKITNIETTANNANTTANTANTTANTANTTANTANTTANTANATANDLKTRQYTFNVANGKDLAANTSGSAQNWLLTSNNTVTFGATSDLNVTTDAAGNIIYGLSDTVKSELANATNATKALGMPADGSSPTFTKVDAGDATTAPTTVVDAVNDIAAAVNKGISIQGNDASAINKELGQTFDIVGTLATDTAASSKNIRTANNNGKLEILMATKPEFEGVTVVDPKDPTKTTTLAPNGTTVTDGTNTATYGADGIGLKGADGKDTKIGTDADGNLTVTNGKDGANAQPQKLVTEGNIADMKGTDGKDGKDGVDATGAPVAGAAGATGLTGKDGLNGASLNDKINALRNGEAGPVVYTDADGNRLVKANDGKYYPADQVGENGEPATGATAVDSPIASVVNPDGSTKAPTIMGNIKSTVGLDLPTDKPITADAAKAGVDTLLNSTKGLNNAATVGDLQALAQAGLDFTGDNNSTTVHRPLGSKLTVEGEGSWNGTTSAADNLYVEANSTNNTLTVKLNSNLTGLNTVGLKGADGKDTKIGTDANGNLTVTNGKDGANAQPQKLVTEGNIADMKGTDGKDGKDGTDATSAGAQGLTGKDGLNGASLDDKINALRNGEAGPVVYTDEDGNRLVKANDGKYYPADQVNADGTPKDGATPVANPIASVVNPDGSTTAPTIMGNLKSTVGLDSPTDKPITADAAKKGVDTLLNSTTGLNNAATVGDLQALAQAGLDFTGDNNSTTVHRPLGSKLTVEGEGSWNGTNSAADNLYVEANATNNTLTVKMNENLTGINSVDFKPTEVTNPDGSKTYAKSTITGAGTKLTETDATGAEVPNGKTAEYGLNGSTLADGTGNVTTTTAAGTKVEDAAGNTANYGANGSTVTDAAGNTANYGANGSTVTDAAGNTANYGANGTTITDAAGNTTTIEAGKTTVSDGTNTTTITPGAITGLNDLADDADGSSAANKNYVDNKVGGLSDVVGTGKDGKDGKDGLDGTGAAATGPTGADGLNGATLTDKVNALRNGEAGPVVYTDAEGNRLVKANDGKYYPADQVNANGTPKDGATAEANPIASVVNPDGSTAKPTTMGNVKSTVGLDSPTDAPITADAAKAGVDTLLNSTKGLNNAATVGDLQALAQAGLDFTGNNNATTVHRPLGSKLTVEGEGAWNGQNSAADNLYVEADAANNKLVVKMNENLTGINKVDFKPTEVTNPDGSKTYAKSTISSAGNTYVETDKDGKAVPNGKSAAYGLNGSTLADGKGNVTNMTAAGTNVVDAAGNTANYGANGSTVADAAGNTANYGANGSTVTDAAGNTASYDANGLTVKDAAGNTVITLVNGDTGPSLNFAKNADGTGTGKITGVAAGDITPDSTDVVTGAQVYALSGGNNVSVNPDGSTTTTLKDANGNLITDESGSAKVYTLRTYNVEGQTEFVTNSVISAVHNMNEQGIKFFHTNDGVVTPVSQADNTEDSSASGAYATAIGYQASASGTQALAIGHGSKASGEQSIAIGTGNEVTGNHSGAIGDPNKVSGERSYVYGNDNTVTTNNTFVVGNNVTTTAENSVVLGNKSAATAGDGSKTASLKNKKTDGTAGTTTTAGSTGTVSTATVGNMTYGGFAGATADGAVSVGAAGNERRVQNVAAGEISATSTDAINGSQLYSVADKFNNKVNALDDKLNRNNKKLRGGIAATTAMANIPQVTLPGKSALGAGVGTYDGQSAVAVGYSRMSDNSRFIIKLSAGATTQGKFNAGAGVAYQW